MSTKLYSGQIVGLAGTPIEVEIDLTPGLHRFTIVGLPDKAVEESRERVSSAIKNSGFRPPQKKNHRITVNLAPADLPKEGAAFDLPIALAYLRESKQVDFNPAEKFFVGELALDGSVRPVRGILPLALAAREAGFKEVFVPEASSHEALLIDGIFIYGISKLSDLILHLTKKAILTPSPPLSMETFPMSFSVDFKDIRGQEFAKRGVEIAAAGNHHVAFTGPPGTGKTLLARATQSILPPLNYHEAVELTSIHSIAGTLKNNVVRERPFRNPHHTASYVSLIGGGTIPRPGEVTLAHRGILFLDEFPEFERRVIETLRQPLEDRLVSISRARGTTTFPADIMLVAAMNPCPCGNKDSQKECVCSPRQMMQYARKISGPIMDRVDIWLTVPQIDHKKLSDKNYTCDSSDTIRKRVIRARALQVGRQKKSNSKLTLKEIEKFCNLESSEQALLTTAAQKLDLSARAYHRILKVARTIADLSEKKNIEKDHLLEALQFRPTEIS
ncbi:MAG: YifB family Mg chelatase-like AAA ATPase [bacterium]|nr:YifB family Mg chelatase-like AAA ATPase [bacterium]